MRVRGQRVRSKGECVCVCVLQFFCESMREGRCKVEILNQGEESSELPPRLGDILLIPYFVRGLLDGSSLEFSSFSSPLGHSSILCGSGCDLFEFSPTLSLSFPLELVHKGITRRTDCLRYYSTTVRLSIEKSPPLRKSRTPRFSFSTLLSFFLPFHFCYKRYNKHAPQRERERKWIKDPEYLPLPPPPQAQSQFHPS